MAEDAEQATEKWDTFLKSCLEGYIDTVESSGTDYYDDKQPTVKGLLIFYINIGTLTPSQAEAMIGRMKDKIHKLIDRLPEGWEAMWMPVRRGNTRVEKIEF